MKTYTKIGVKGLEESIGEPHGSICEASQAEPKWQELNALCLEYFSLLIRKLWNNNSCH